MATIVWSASVAVGLVPGKCVVMLDPYRWHRGVWTVVSNCTVVGRGGKGLL